MIGEEDRLFELEEMLLALPEARDAMLLADLDGFVVGLILSPEPVPSSEWLPKVLGDATGAPPLGREQMDRTVAAILAHHGAVARDLRLGRYLPQFDIDDRDGDLIWETWIDDFVTAMELRDGAWRRLIAAGDDPAMAASTLVLLADLGSGRSELPEDKIEQLASEAPELIERCVATLHARPGAQAAPVVAAARRIGRNDPCPCGSGRKFKKCCGA
jgi:uncharacterized protein